MRSSAVAGRVGGWCACFVDRRVGPSGGVAEHGGRGGAGGLYGADIPARPATCGLSPGLGSPLILVDDAAQDLPPPYRRFHIDDGARVVVGRVLIKALMRPMVIKLAFVFTKDGSSADVAEAALVMAIASRGGDVEGVIFHSDRGSEFTAEAFEIACRRQGVIQSMARVGTCLDNAVHEAFHSTVKVECIYRQRFGAREEARTKISNWILTFL